MARKDQRLSRDKARATYPVSSRWRFTDGVVYRADWQRLVGRVGTVVEVNSHRLLLRVRGEKYLVAVVPGAKHLVPADE